MSLPPWTSDPHRAGEALRRRGDAGSPERELWDALFGLAVRLDVLADDLTRAAGDLPRLITEARRCADALPPPDPWRGLPLNMVTPLRAKARSARLALLAESLVALAAAPRARNSDTLRQDAADALAGLVPLLVAWRKRLRPPTPAAEEPSVARLRAPDDRY